MNIQDLKNKLVAVLGYGTEGKAVTGYLIKHEIEPVLFDQRPWAEWPKAEQESIKELGINFIFGPDCFKELAGFNIGFRSPGIKISQLTINNLQLTSQTKFFFDNCPCKIIGVTGTKGKGTTATLISEILRLQCQMSNVKCQTYLTGNIGKIQPFDIIDNLKPEDWVIYELSSFQLQDLTVSPRIAVVLMTTSEHLDYHKDNQEYTYAKSAITKFQTGDDFAIINADYPSSVQIGGLGQGKKLYFSRKNNNPKLKPDIFIAEGEIKNQQGDFHLPISKLQLRGEHNLENVCAAVLAAHAAGASSEAIIRAVANFKGLEHRLEFTAEKNGVKFYNDSFSTTPETAIAAIKSFVEPLVLILGGSSKNSDFSELGAVIANSKNIKVVVLVGEEGPRIKALLNGFKGKILQGAESMEEIFSQVKQVAEKGGVVLLSPACASFDMFKNYQDRGEQFKNFANKF